MLVYCVNDMAVMQAWFDDMMIKPSSIVTPCVEINQCVGCGRGHRAGAASMAWRTTQRLARTRRKILIFTQVTPLADPTRSFTKALDLEMEGTPPQLGYVRSKRFAAVFDDGKCTNLFVSAAPGDPAGDDDPSASLVENVLKSL